MSVTTEEILEKLKTISLFEAKELVSQIEETFDVDASAPTGGFQRDHLKVAAQELKLLKKKRLLMLF